MRNIGVPENTLCVYIHVCVCVFLLVSRDEAVHEHVYTEKRGRERKDETMYTCGKVAKVAGSEKWCRQVRLPVSHEAKVK